MLGRMISPGDTKMREIQFLPSKTQFAEETNE